MATHRFEVMLVPLDERTLSNASLPCPALPRPAVQQSDPESHWVVLPVPVGPSYNLLVSPAGPTIVGGTP